MMGSKSLFRLPIPDGVERPDCGECGEPMVLLKTPQWGYWWGCSRFPACKGGHGAHQETLAPLGDPGDKETRAARVQAHKLFDVMWKEEGMSRAAAYGWLRTVMFLTREKAHIAMFSRAQCERLIAILNERRSAAEKVGGEK